MTMALEDTPDLDVVCQAANDREPADLVLKEQPGIVLMDILMPLLDGLEATRRILRDSPQVRIVVRTGVAGPGVAWTSSAPAPAASSPKLPTASKSNSPSAPASSGACQQPSSGAEPLPAAPSPSCRPATTEPSTSPAENTAAAAPTATDSGHSHAQRGRARRSHAKPST